MRSAIGTIVKRTIKIASAYVAIVGTVAPDTLITGQCGESDPIGFSEQQFRASSSFALARSRFHVLKFSSPEAASCGFRFGVLSLNVSSARELAVKMQEYSSVFELNFILNSVFSL